MLGFLTSNRRGGKKGYNIFKIGDKVRIKNNLREAEKIAIRQGKDSSGIVDKMLEFEGKYALIREASQQYYKLLGNGWTWNSWMFEDITKNELDIE